MKKIRFVILTGTLAVLGIIVYAARYNALLHSTMNGSALRDITPPASLERCPLTQEELVNLGWLSAGFLPSEKEKIPSYFHHPLEKDPGSVRIGIFGGSNALCGGEKEGRDYSYPSLLQERFKAAGMEHVTVINFGTSAYGMAQQYYLWQVLGRSYGLDYAVFTVHDNDRTRDTSFKDPDAYSPLHARYILENGRLKLLPVSGKTRGEALKAYLRLLPPWPYVRYDKNMPMLLKAALPSTLHSRINPFYYKRFSSEEDELLPIYAAMFKEAAAQAKHVVVLANENDIPALRRSVGATNVHFFAPKANAALRACLYFDPSSTHPNAWGNRIKADELFAYLTGKRIWKSSVLELTASPRPNPGPYAPLTNYDKASLRVNQTPVADLFGDGQEPFLKAFPGSLSQKSARTESLLLLPFEDARRIFFLPLSFLVQDGGVISLVCAGTKETTRIPVGSVRDASGTLGRAVWDTGGVRILPEWNDRMKNFDLALEIENEGLLRKMPFAPKEIGLELDGRRILALQPENTWHRIRRSLSGDVPLRLPLKKPAAGWLFLQSPDEVAWEGDPFDRPGGTLDLVLTGKNGAQDRLPIFTYRFVPVEETLPDPLREPVIPDSGFAGPKE